ncbi:MAG: conjugal transfer protein TraX [Eubacterium sp.]|nr:conjugal transfer protein TraX [Eubacterium sp.]
MEKQKQIREESSMRAKGPRRMSFHASGLKTAAIIAMIIDHFTASILTYCLYPTLSYEMQESCYEAIMFLRTMGRLAFPVFCFFIVEGALHTRNIKKYAGRLLLFGVISEIPFDLAIFGGAPCWEYQNVYWTLLIGLAVIAFLEKYQGKTPAIFLLRFAIMLAGLFAAYLIKSDYSVAGVLVIIAFYLCRRYRILQIAVGVVLMLWELQNIWIWIPVVLFVFLLWNYDGTRGRSMKYFFYAFYPVHLLIFGLIRMYIQL